ncbi:hypothetical protein PUN28_001688 [Cardiocondyla obscurior]|uniref:Uncharacterized protein n=1 Tax=Cardiocondyla obscurior TaxID=286306 RepID=A0AAW2GQR4_9HYME
MNIPIFVIIFLFNMSIVFTTVTNVSIIPFLFFFSSICLSRSSRSLFTILRSLSSLSRIRSSRSRPLKKKAQKKLQIYLS